MSTPLEEVRRQVLRPVRYASNALALRNHLVPPEAPFDTALTNGLLAIVAAQWPGNEYSRKGMTLAASVLLDFIDSQKPRLALIDVPVLRDGLDLTQPARHGRSDDEFASLNESHIGALLQLDEHYALRVLELAEGRTVDALLWQAFLERAEDQLPRDLKDRLNVPEPEECDECWRPTFLATGWDMFGGNDAPGVCVACGYVRTDAVADDRAITAAVRRAVEKDD